MEFSEAERDCGESDELANEMNSSCGGFGCGRQSNSAVPDDERL